MPISYKIDKSCTHLYDKKLKQVLVGADINNDCEVDEI